METASAPAASPVANTDITDVFEVVNIASFELIFNINNNGSDIDTFDYMT